MNKFSPYKLASCFFLIGAVFAIYVQLVFVRNHNCDVSMLINVGESSALRPHIEKDYGPVCLVGGIGHDGTFSYLLARDPFLTRGTAELIAQSGESVAYRGRRILMSLLGGGMGLLGPHATLWGIIIVGALGVGLSSFVFTYWIAEGKHSPFLLLAIFLNVGVICSLTTLTADHLALSLALLGLFLGLKGYRLAAMFMFALSGLTKETYLLIAFSFFLLDVRRSSFRTAAFFFVGSFLPLLAWLCYLHSYSPQEPLVAVRSNLGLPFQGLMSSIPGWRHHQGTQDKVFHGVLLLSALGLIVITLRLRSLFFSALSIPWLILLTLLGDIVWDVGNNTARAGSMVIALLGLAPMVKTMQATRGSSSDTSR